MHCFCVGTSLFFFVASVFIIACVYVLYGRADGMGRRPACCCVHDCVATAVGLFILYVALNAA